MSPKPSQLPGFFGSLCLGPAALIRVFARPQILLPVFGLFFFLSLFQVLPAWQILHRQLDSTPLADGRGGRLLLEELVRLHPGAEPSIHFGGLLALFLMMFFAGGAVMIGTQEKAGRKLSAFLCCAGSNFLRSLRTFLVFLLLLVLWTFVVAKIADALPPAFSEGGNETALFRRELLISVLWGMGFFLLLFLRRLALARMVLWDRRSALLAYFSSFWLLLRHPLALFLSCLGLCLIVGLVFLGGSFLVDRFEAVEASALPIFVLGQGIFLTIQASLLASFALAARVWELDQGIEAEPAPKNEPRTSPAPSPDPTTPS